jgi:hypothetical protein
MNIILFPLDIVSFILLTTMKWYSCHLIDKETEAQRDEMSQT